jgi:hypothetical protein
VAQKSLNIRYFKRERTLQITFARTLDDNIFFRSLTMELFFYSCVERGVDYTFEWIIAAVLQKSVALETLCTIKYLDKGKSLTVF